MVGWNEDLLQRSTARFRGAEVTDSTGEVSHDGGVTWQPDFTMDFQRVEQEADDDLEGGPAREMETR
jgi:hypothetical protein